MPQFSYRALTQAGDVVAGRVEAPSREEVIRRIEYLGHLPIDAQTATEGFLRRGLAVKRRDPQCTIFLRRLTPSSRRG
jgi:general secretion pathway protein F